MRRIRPESSERLGRQAASCIRHSQHSARKTSFNSSKHEGTHTKVEEGGKVFPVSNRASDVLAALVERLNRSGAELALSEPLQAIEPLKPGFRLTTPHRVIESSSIVLTPGGMSYPGCGTTGDGYSLSAALGHTIVTPRPALTPVLSSATWIEELRRRFFPT